MIVPPNKMLKIENLEILNRPMVQLNAAKTRLNPFGHSDIFDAELMVSRRLVVFALLLLPLLLLLL